MFWIWNTSWLVALQPIIKRSQNEFCILPLDFHVSLLPGKHHCWLGIMSTMFLICFCFKLKRFFFTHKDYLNHVFLVLKVIIVVFWCTISCKKQSDMIWWYIFSPVINKSQCCYTMRVWRIKFDLNLCDKLKLLSKLSFPNTAIRKLELWPRDLWFSVLPQWSYFPLFHFHLCVIVGNQRYSLCTNI